MLIRATHFPALLLPFVLAGLGVAEIHAQTTEVSPPVPDGSAADSRVVTGDRTIEAGQSIDEIVVVDGDLRVRGEVTGNAVVVNGDLILEETGSILGDAMVTAGELINQGGRVRGEMRTLNGSGIQATSPAAATISAPEPRVEVRASSRDRDRNESFFPSEIRRGIAGIIATLALGLVLAGVGTALVFYARPYLETVSDTIRGATVRSAATGLAATFLAVPAFVVLIVALAVSIVGIPFLLIAIPLYPVALFGAAVFGLLAVMHAVGERTAEQSRDVLDLRYRNSYAYLFAGLGMLLVPHLAGHMISMTGFLRFIGTLLHVITWIAMWAAATVGFGAVILSRAGRRRTFVPVAPDVSSYEADDLFGDDALGGRPNA